MNRQTTPSDESLVLAARGGDREAFAQLVDRYFRTIWTIAYARLRDHSRADDLTQEVFLLALLHLHSISDPHRFAQWVCRIARNRALDWLRQDRRSSNLVAMVPMESLIGAADAVEEPEMDRDEEHQAVRDAIFALPEDQREIILLRFSEGLNNSEIARRFDVHPVTIGRQLDKAMVSLRQLLEPMVAESVCGLKPSRRAVMQTTAMAGAVAAMPSSSQAALTSAAAQIALPSTGSSLLKGTVLFMAMEKLKAGVIAGIALILSIGIIAGVRLSSGPVGAVDSKTVAPANAVSHPVPFSNGVVVELLGIQAEPWDGGKWWSASGSEIPAPGHPGEPRINVSSSSGRVLRIMFQIGGLRRDQSFIVNVSPAQRTMHSGYSTPSGTMIEAWTVVPEDASTAEFRIGLAAGPWTDDVQYDVATSQYSDPSLFKVNSISEENGETIVEIERLPDWIGVARDRTLVVAAGQRTLEFNHANSRNAVMKYYFKCAKSELTQVVARSRPYEWMAIKNVSLMPSAASTDVQVMPSTQPATAP